MVGQSSVQTGLIYSFYFHSTSPGGGLSQKIPAGGDSAHIDCMRHTGGALGPELESVAQPWLGYGLQSLTFSGFRFSQV